MISEYYKRDEETEQESNISCMVVVAKGLSIPRLVATLLYDRYSINIKSNAIELGPNGVLTAKQRECSNYLIFIINFDEIDYRLLQLNM